MYSTDNRLYTDASQTNNTCVVLTIDYTDASQTNNTCIVLTIDYTQMHHKQTIHVHVHVHVYIQDCTSLIDLSIMY